MSMDHYNLGRFHYNKGRPFPEPREYDGWDWDEQLDYEFGRLSAAEHRAWGLPECPVL
jgi:hypothetical protein